MVKRIPRTNIVDISGEKFNKLLALRFDHSLKHKSYFLFVCDCGNERVFRSASVKKGATASCGDCFKGKSLTQGILKYFVKYNPNTGIFRWTFPRLGNSKNGIAGHVSKDGYTRTNINSVKYLNHRLAWLYIYGYFPEGTVDHIDRNPANNRIKNLRVVSHQCNLRNTGNSKNNTSGIKGVCKKKKDNKWTVRISLNCKEIYIGRFTDFTEAVAHRLAAEQCLEWSNCDSNSPAYIYMQNYLKGEKK